MNSIMSVIRFTFMQRFRSKSFIWTTVIFAVLLTGLFYLPRVIDYFSDNKAVKVGMVDSKETPVAGLLKTYFADQKEPSIEIVLFADQGSADANEVAAKKLIHDGEIKGYLELAEVAGATFPSAIYKSKDATPFKTSSNLQSGLNIVKQTLAVQDAGLTPEQMQILTTPLEFDTMQISTSTDKAGTGKTESQVGMAYVLVYVLIMLLYITVLGYGNMVAMEITSEKNTRVMELLISSVAPLKQMFGKIIGICLLGLTQTLIFIAVIVAQLSVPQNRDALKDLDIDISSIDASLLVYFAIFYLLGYLIYATLFAAVGSLVSRTEEVGQAIMPITLVIVVAFMLSMYGLQNPDAGIIKTMSYIPLFSPLLMFLRIGMSQPAIWEIGLSLGILLASVYLFSWFAAKIYRTGVLMYGKRPSLKELRKAMKAYDV